ncbi:MAG TPA: VWA domain-containing protein, partial [Gemmataceae bacterium]|nr:VWA domain-containing protein [Gemmataceae bacterium]
MTTFVHPYALLAIAGIPVLAWWWLKRRRHAAAFPSLAITAGARLGRALFARWGVAILRIGALLLLIVALAGPRLADWGSRLPAEGIAFELVMDVSGSMAEPDFVWQGESVSRLDAAKRAMRFLVRGGPTAQGSDFEGRPRDLIGLVAFARWPDDVCPPTLSHGALLTMMEKERPRTVPIQSETNIGDALALALYRLERAPTKRKNIVLITDGEHNVPRPALTPGEAAILAARQRVPIYVIDCAGAKEAPADKKTMRAKAVKDMEEVAHATAGRYFRASDTDALVTACHDIDKLERSKFQSFVYGRYYDCYPWFGAAALAAWVSAT